MSMLQYFVRSALAAGYTTKEVEQALDIMINNYTPVCEIPDNAGLVIHNGKIQKSPEGVAAPTRQ